MAVLKAVDIVIGKKYKMKNDALLAYGVPKGTTVTVTYKGGNAINVTSSLNPSPLATNVSALDYLNVNKKEIETQIKEYEDLIKVEKDRLAWMEEVGADNYDEDEFKVWQVLNTLDQRKLSKIDKTKAIVRLIRG